VGTSLPGHAVAAPGGELDKAAHFGIYLILAWTVCRALARTRGAGTRVFAAAFLALALFAAADEAHQNWIPGRRAELADWLADLAGLGVGILGFWGIGGGRIRGGPDGAGRTGRGGGGSRGGGADPAPFTDLHTHLIPGVDDGARDGAEAVGALRELTAAGARAVVATPHLEAALTSDPDRLAARLEELEEGWTRLLRAAREANLGDLRLERGAEIALDAPDPDLSDPRLRLAGTPYVLVEFPRLEVPPFATRRIRAVSEAGWRPILAHPERYAGLGENPEAVEAWRAAGAHLQVNAGSLLGQFGREARALAWALLERGVVTLLSTDHHGRGPVRVAEVRAAIAEREEEGDGQAGRRGTTADGAVGDRARLLLETNPGRILEGRSPMAVPPLPERSEWGG